MEPSQIKTAVDQALAAHFSTVNEVLTKHTEDLKTFGAVQESTKQAIADLNVKGAALVTEQQAEKLKQDAIILDLQQKMLDRKTGAGGNRRKSAGELFTESDELKDFLPLAKLSKGNFTSKPFQLKNITSAGVSGGSGIVPEYLPTPIIPNFQNLTVRDLLSEVTTSTNLIYWLQENVFTNAANVVSEGALKPQSDITYERKNIPITTIAHWMKASKQVLADFGLLMGLIDTRLKFGLALEEEKQLLYGDGTGDNILGLVPQATAYNQGTKANDTEIDIIARAMLQVRLAFYPATGVVMSPTDWWNIMLTKDAQHRYLFSSPIAGTSPYMIWGLPVAISDSFHPGDFLVGSMKLGATLFDREQAQILISTEDQDNFVRNMVTILCEERIGLAVTRPQSFVYGSFPSGTST